MGTILSRSRRLLTFAVITCLVAMNVGCSGQVAPLPDNTQSTSLQTPATVSKVFTATLPSAVWQNKIATFSDPSLGLSIDIPSDWCIIPRTEPPIVTWGRPSYFSSPCFPKAPYVLPPCTKIEIVPGPAPVRSLGQLREESVPTTTVIFQERQMSLHGLPALWIETEIGIESDAPTGPKRPIVWVLVLIGDRSVRLTAYGEFAPVADIVNSIRPINK
jgi:hypothetical protein